MNIKMVEVFGNTYELIHDRNEGFEETLFLEKCTDYFIGYDYIVGDFSYNKLRLKGFYDDSNPKVTLMNNIKHLDEYLDNFCAFGCRYYVLKKKNID